MFLFLLSVSSSLTSFQIFPLSIPETPAGFTSYIVQVIAIYFEQFFTTDVMVVL
jgi:hypothetical protein